jgi:hypothetical protein
VGLTHTIFPWILTGQQACPSQYLDNPIHMPAIAIKKHWHKIKISACTKPCYKKYFYRKK